MVDFTYFGADGKKHSFGANSPKDAMERLGRIPGFTNANADALTASLAQGLKDRRKKRAAEFASRSSDSNSPYETIDGLRNGDSVTRISVVTGVTFDSKTRTIYAETTDLLIPKSIGISRNGRYAVGTIPEAVTAKSNESSGTMITVVTGSTYDTKTHKFVNQTADVVVKNIVKTGSEEVFTAVQETW